MDLIYSNHIFVSTTEANRMERNSNGYHRQGAMEGKKWMDRDVHDSLHPAPSANRASRPFSRPSLTLPALKSKAASTEDASLTQWKGEKAYRMVERGAYVLARKENHRTMPLRHPRTNLSHPRAHGLKVGPAARPPRTGLHLQDETYEQSDQIDMIRAHRRLPVKA